MVDTLGWSLAPDIGVGPHIVKWKQRCTVILNTSRFSKQHSSDINQKHQGSIQNWLYNIDISSSDNAHRSEYLTSWLWAFSEWLRILNKVASMATSIRGSPVYLKRKNKFRTSIWCVHNLRYTRPMLSHWFSCLLPISGKMPKYQETL